jgi:hypothetical protein
MGKVSLLTSQWFVVWYIQGAYMATNSLMKSLESLNPEQHDEEMVEKYIESFRMIEKYAHFGAATQKLAAAQLKAFENHLAALKKTEEPKSKSECVWEDNKPSQEGDRLVFDSNLPTELTEMLDAAKKSGIYSVSFGEVRWVYNEATASWDTEYDP